MTVFVITFAVITLAILALAVGLLFGRKGIAGSCGGLNRIGGIERECPVCSGRCANARDLK